MSKPSITESLGGYVFTWTDELITIKVSRMDIHKDGRVTGELLITTEAKDFNTVLHPQTQFNFSADRTRKELIKSLTENIRTNGTGSRL